jgi:hypothetical protein
MTLRRRWLGSPAAAARRRRRNSTPARTGPGPRAVRAGFGPRVRSRAPLGAHTLRIPAGARAALTPNLAKCDVAVLALCRTRGAAAGRAPASRLQMLLRLNSSFIALSARAPRRSGATGREGAPAGSSKGVGRACRLGRLRAIARYAGHDRWDRPVTDRVRF